MTAASLAQHFRGTNLSISLIESPEIDTVGVGEATTPTIRNFYKSLGMNDEQVLTATNGTCKLGIKFDGWLNESSSFIHPFGSFGQDLKNVNFIHYWLKAKSLGSQTKFDEYSLGCMLAHNNKFSQPIPNPQSSLAVFDWALHLDAKLFANHLKEYAIERDVKHHSDTIEHVGLKKDSGYIDSLTLASGKTITADFFIDCSGFRSVLIGKALGVPYIDWSELLLCDSAYFAPSASTKPTPPYTQVTARTAGWQWRIPLQHRTGNGYVYSSKFIDDETAKTELLANLEDVMDEPKFIRFTPGRREKSWYKNCVAIGLSSGFLEPLESTSIALIETAIERVKQLFPTNGFDPYIIDEYNEVSALEYERVRDFIILHYKLNQRKDSEFWSKCRAMDIPDTLDKKINLYKHRGYFLRYRWEMFHPASWQAIYSGFNLYPKSYDLSVDSLPNDYLTTSLNAMKESVTNFVTNAKDHDDFLRTYKRDKT
ncbi:MAG: tryptophan 7-halogenase [Gammaproteobacteria bacterium]|nr:tryptophan 7-halogenase [Gammaproteobacteria bacterium]